MYKRSEISEWWTSIDTFSRWTDHDSNCMIQCNTKISRSMTLDRDIRDIQCYPRSGRHVCVDLESEWLQSTWKCILLRLSVILGAHSLVLVETCESSDTKASPLKDFTIFPIQCTCTESQRIHEVMTCLSELQPFLISLWQVDPTNYVMGQFLKLF